MAIDHTPHPRLQTRKESAPHQRRQKLNFNDKVAIMITNAVGTMWCAYLFALLALVSLPAAIQGGVATLISWIAQTFLQLVLLSVIMVGQKIAAKSADKLSEQTYKDAEALLEVQDEVHKLIKINNQLTAEIHEMVKQK